MTEGDCSGLKVIEVDPKGDQRMKDLYQSERALRYEILRKPLGGKYASAGKDCEWFPFEMEAYHVVCVENDKEVIGCVLFHPDEKREGGRLFQMAVHDRLQGKGVGSRLVRFLEEKLRGEGFKSISIHSRHYSVKFYEKLGYLVVGEPFEEVGIQHSNMYKELN
eukprot:Nk52_evm17s1705 gene=Nk52_evmTU17s1705